MSALLQRLYPAPGETVELKGLYLGLNLHTLGTSEQPFVYANFLASLDGRIALEDPDDGSPYVPKRLTSANDFRLFLELEAQADCLITHGGYLRALAAGQLGNILQIGQREDTGDLAQWRLDHGLSSQPALVIASASLDFPMPPSIREHQQTCLIATSAQADPGKIAHWRERGYEVMVAGQGKLVEGAALVRALGVRGYRCLYLIAGPHMLETMVRERQLACFFHTTTHQLLGGSAFRTLIPGSELGSAGNLTLRSLYLDDSDPASASQWFAQFDTGYQ